MPTHSLDLRQRIVAAYQAGGTSIGEVAKRFIAKRGVAIGNEKDSPSPRTTV